MRFLAALAILPAVALSGSAGAQTGSAPPCAPGVAPAATIHGFDVEDEGGKLTATHTIGLDARDRDGVISRTTFALPARATIRDSDGNPSFSVDTPGPVPVTATWEHEVQTDEQDYVCTATAHGTLRMRPAREWTFTGLRPGPSLADSYSMAIKTGKNADLRPVVVRLRGVRRARVPGPGARVQATTFALRRGDAGLWRGESRKLRAAGWRFQMGNVDGHLILMNATVIDSRRGRRGPARGFGYSIQVSQAGRFAGRVRVVGRCGFLGCSWRAL